MSTSSKFDKLIWPIKWTVVNCICFHQSSSPGGHLITNQPKCHAIFCIKTWSHPLRTQDSYALYSTYCFNSSSDGGFMCREIVGLSTDLKNRIGSSNSLLRWTGFEANWRPSWKYHPKFGVFKQIILWDFWNSFRMQPICFFRQLQT